jgi:carbon starvation protein
MAVFSMAIAGLFVSMPTAVLPINIEIVISIFFGFLLYKKNNKPFIISVAGLILLYLFVYVGSYIPLSFGSYGIDKSSQITIWILLLFIYSAIASLLPVWLLLQPRDYLNSHQLMVGLFLIYAGIFIAQPSIEAPMIRSSENGGPSIFPLLFVTVACGAISGFHGLIASGTTSKQISDIKHTKLIGYGSMLGEGTLALASTIAAVAGISLVKNCSLPSIGYVENLSWDIYYDNWAHAATNKATAFVLGGGALIESLGISAILSQTITAVLVISFAATTLDTATRVQRFIITEVGKSAKIEVLSNRYFSTILAILPALLLTLGNIVDPISGQKIKLGWALWPIFGASNQMLASLILMLLSIYFWKKNKPIYPLFIPFVFITITTFTSLLFNANLFIQHGNYFLLAVEIVLIFFLFWVLFEGFKIYKSSD